MAETGLIHVYLAVQRESTKAAGNWAAGAEMLSGQSGKAIPEPRLIPGAARSVIAHVSGGFCRNLGGTTDAFMAFVPVGAEACIIFQRLLKKMLYKSKEK